MEKEREYIMTLIGDKGVGKTSIIEVFMEGKKSDSNRDEKRIVLNNGVPAKIIIYDIDGDSLNKEDYEILKKSDVIYMVHDMSNNNSLINVAKKYTPLVKKYGKSGSTKSILSAKRDLCSFPMRVFDQIDIFSDEYNLSPQNESCSIKMKPQLIYDIFEHVARVRYFYDELQKENNNEKEKENKTEEKNKNNNKEDELEEEDLKESKVENKERYTEVENDVLDNPIEGYKEDKEKEQNENENNEKEKEKENRNKEEASSNRKKEFKKLKVIFLGEKDVGKTSIINRYVNNKFASFTQASFGDDIKQKKIEIDNTLIVDLAISDTTNEEKLGKITRNYYLDAHGAIIVFDLTNENSFSKVKFWIDELKSNAPRDIVYCILGNKSDLTADRKVELEDAKAIAEDNLYYEISAKTGNNVSLAFEQLIDEIIEKQKEEEKNPDKVPRGKEGRKTTNLNEINKEAKKKKCC